MMSAHHQQASSGRPSELDRAQWFKVPFLLECLFLQHQNSVGKCKMGIKASEKLHKNDIKTNSPPSSTSE
jgi:hypothetical protein